MTPRRLTVVGTGYVGLVTAACLARDGHTVVGLDVDANKVLALTEGEVPFFEPGLEVVVAEAMAAGRLSFTADAEVAYAGTEIAFLAVGTPSANDGSLSLTYLFAAADTAAQHLPPHSILVIRSTVPPGTTASITGHLRQAGRDDVRVVHAPEFLAEGTAVRDFGSPDRLVCGGPTDACADVLDLFAACRPEAPRLVMAAASAECVKMASNTFLAARISLINEVARVCDQSGADVGDVAQAVGLDDRIGPRFLRPGIGYGGSCFPKDVRSLAAHAAQAGLHMDLIPAIEAANDRQGDYALDLLREALGGNLDGKRVAVWGLAFKPGTDDLRSAPSLRLIDALASAGASVTVHDPVAQCPAETPAHFHASPVDTVRDADALIVVTEWPEYADLAPADVAAAMAGRAVIDARNCLHHAAWARAGFDIRGIGTRPVEVEDTA